MISIAMNAAVSGMRAQSTRFLHIGNNIANSSTTGYKSNDALFSETVSSIIGGNSANNLKLQSGNGVEAIASDGDFSHGQIQIDGDPAHVAIRGDGFFPVRIGNDSNNFVSRAGDFSIVEDSQNAGQYILMRPDGSVLQGTTNAGDPLGAAPGSDVRFTDEPLSFEIKADGSISATFATGSTGAVQNGNIGLKRFLNPDTLNRLSGQNFEITDSTVPLSTNLEVPGSTSGVGQVVQRALEQSNVDLTTEFTKMIVTQRNFQANAKTITDHVAVLRPHVWLMLGHCAGLRNSQTLGDYVLAHGYVRDDNVLDQDLPTWVPIPPLAEVQVALEDAVAEVTGIDGYDLKKLMRTGTVVSLDNRNWELWDQSELVKRFSQSRAIALDMESATIAANGFRFRVPYGTLLCISDKPLHGELKLPGMATDFYKRQVAQHLQIGIRSVEKMRNMTAERLHSRKLRSFAETAFQ